MSWKPYQGGIEIHNLVEFDPAGSIPGWIKTEMSKRMANGLETLVNYLQTG